MSVEKLKEEVKETIALVGYSGAKKEFSALLKATSARFVAEFLTTMIISDYTLYKAGNIAVLLEHALKEEPAIAEVREPQHFLFNVCLFTGSWALYECFMEEYVEQHITGMDEYDAETYLIDLCTTAEPIIEELFNNYETQQKGLHFNGAFRSERPGLVQMHMEDYEKMDDLVENYNKIIGRRDILEDLYRRVDEY